MSRSTHKRRKPTNPQTVKSIVIGLAVTALVFFASNYMASQIYIPNHYFPRSLITHFLMGILALIAIFIFGKRVKFRIAPVKLKRAVKVFLITLIGTVVINFLMTILVSTLSGQPPESHPALSKLNPWQVFFFVFILASIAEELLFRAFLLNYIRCANCNRLYIFKKRISLPVIISALAFGLAHLSLLQSDVSAYFILRIVIFTTFLGGIAAYYQEKYNNFSYALIAHMTGNLPALIASFVIL